MCVPGSGRPRACVYRVRTKEAGAPYRWLVHAGEELNSLQMRCSSTSSGSKHDCRVCRARNESPLLLLLCAVVRLGVNNRRIAACSSMALIATVNCWTYNCAQHVCTHARMPKVWSDESPNIKFRLLLYLLISAPYLGFLVF